VDVTGAVAVELNCDRMSQRIDERFVRDPEGDPKSRLWVAGVGRGYGYPKRLTNEELSRPAAPVVTVSR
jgi:hypothetical protein